MKKKTTTLESLVAIVTVLLVFNAGASAGDLEPSAPPGPTMKPLDQVEPRIPIASLPYTITASGSYYLTGDLSSTGSGITVNADNVTIDLMGYSIAGGSGVGIYMDGRRNVEIRNGTVRGFGSHGIHEEGSGSGHRVISVRAVLNGGYGIYLQYGQGHLVKDCTAAENIEGGIFGYSNNMITGNLVYNNQGYGIYIYWNGTVTGNTAYGNQGVGIFCYLTSCMVKDNVVIGNTGSGIAISEGGTVSGNTVRGNNQSDNANEAGIQVYSDCLVKNNTVVFNKQNNIYVSGSDNIVEENLVTDSTNGIYFSSTGNFYANNRASGNTTNYAGSLPTGSGDGGGNVGF